MSIASQLRRAEMLSADSAGRRIRRVDRYAIGYTLMPVRETKPHALSYANTDTSEEHQEQERREREARARFDALDLRDREILRLYLTRHEPREITMPFPASQREGLERAGWLYMRTLRSGYVMMVKSIQGQLTHSEIGERVHLSTSQVRRRLNRMDMALVKFAELRGWL